MDLQANESCQEEPPVENSQCQFGERAPQKWSLVSGTVRAESTKAQTGAPGGPSETGAGPPQSNSASASGSFEASSSKVRSALGLSQRVFAGSLGSAEAGQCGGPFVDREARGDIYGRRGPEHRSVPHSSGYLFQSHAQVAGNDKATSVQAVAAGVEEALPPPQQAAHSLGSGMPLGDQGFGRGQQGLGNAHASDVLPLSEANRGFASATGGHRCTGQRRGPGLSGLHSGAASPRNRHPVQDSGVRRKPHPRPYIPSGGRPCPEELLPTAQQAAAFSETHQSRIARFPFRSKCISSLGQSRTDPPIQVQTWGSQSRHVAPPPGLSRSAEEGALEEPIASVRRYEKGSRLAQLFAGLPKQVQEQSMAAARALRGRLCSLR